MTTEMDENDFLPTLRPSESQKQRKNKLYESRYRTISLMQERYMLYILQQWRKKVLAKKTQHQIH